MPLYLYQNCEGDVREVEMPLTAEHPDAMRRDHSRGGELVPLLRDDVVTNRADIYRRIFTAPAAHIH